MLKWMLCGLISCSVTLASGEAPKKPFSTKPVCSDPCEQVLKETKKEEKACVLKYHCKRKVKWRTKTKVVEKRVYVIEKERYPKNSVGILLGLTQTGLEANTFTPATTTVETSTQADAGLMYQRDIERDVRLSIGATLRRSFYLGVGLNW